MKGKIFVSGSIAYDFIMKFEGFFHDAILKEHLEDLDLAFVGKDRKMHFGGCGGNIAYSLSLLDEKPFLYGLAGKDFDEYGKWLKKNKISTEYIGRDPNEFTAAAYILTDRKENQITIFSSGAMESFKYEKKLLKKDLKGIKYAILSPDICERTVRLAKTLISAKIPYFYDPGQLIHAFKQKDLEFLCKNAYGFIANSYETKLLKERLKSKLTIIDNIKIFVETLGKRGCKLKANSKTYKIPAVKPKRSIDPTGCGDAFRSGVLAGLCEGFNAKKACQMGALLATYNIENSGTQNHAFTKQQFYKRYKENFSD